MAECNDVISFFYLRVLRTEPRLTAELFYLNWTFNYTAFFPTILIYFEYYCVLKSIPFLSDTLKCVPLRPPANGAVACDNWMGGEICQAQCRNGTEMPNVNLGTLYVCNTRGDWGPPPSLKPCEGNRIRLICTDLFNCCSLYFRS